MRLLTLIPTILVFGFVVPHAEAWTLQNLEVSKVRPTTCTAPTVALLFSNTDSYMYEYFVLQGMKVGDQASIRWITPMSGFYTTTWGKQTSAGNFCFTGGYLTNAQFSPYPGGWWIEVYVNGQYQGHSPFSVQASIPTITLLRSTLTQFTVTGSPQGGGFKYSATAYATAQLSPGTTAQSNPNSAVLSSMSNPSTNGAPSPGALSTVTTTYTPITGNALASRFHVGTFGLSCYYTAAQQDWGTAPNSCSTITIAGTKYSGHTLNPPGLPKGD